MNEITLHLNKEEYDLLKDALREAKCYLNDKLAGNRVVIVHDLLHRKEAYGKLEGKLAIQAESVVTYPTRGGMDGWYRG